MILILLVAMILFFIIFYREKELYIHAGVKGILAWCFCMYSHVELFSYFNILSRFVVFMFWLAVCILEIIYLKCEGRLCLKNKVLFNAKNGGSEQLEVDYKCLKSVNFLKEAVGWNIFFVIVFVLMFLLAFLTVPYNWDSMTYHLPRIAHWAQNKSVGHYATNIIRQVANPPFHEFICLDIYLLSGKKDIWFNCVQCFSFWVNAWLIYEMARKLGCTEKYCQIGMLIFCSMPIAFGEAMTTQNDNLAGMFLIIFLYYILDFYHKEKKIQKNKETFETCCIMSASIGFGYMTKPVVSMGMVFLTSVLLVLIVLRWDNIKTVMQLVCVVAPIIFIIIMPEIFKNFKTFHAFFPPGTGARQLVATLDFRYLFVNGIKNFSVNLPTFLIPESSQILVLAIYKAAALIGVNVDDASISEDGRAFQLGTAHSFGHDTAVSSTCFITAILVCVWCIYRRKKVGAYQRFYTYIVMLMFGVVCIFIRWNAFVSRYLLPYLAVLCPMVSVWIEDIAKSAKSRLIKYSWVVVGWLGILGILLLFLYHGRVVVLQKVSRPEGYFKVNPEVQANYCQACDIVQEKDAKSLGLMLEGDSYEYPIWYMLNENVDRIEHIMVKNATARYEDLSFVPDCILSTKDLGNTTLVRKNEYEKIMSETNLYVYEMVR